MYYRICDLSFTSRHQISLTNYKDAAYDISLVLGAAVAMDRGVLVSSPLPLKGEQSCFATLKMWVWHWP
jgi:hypothetical protein